jgi:exonuclease SbcC
MKIKSVEITGFRAYENPGDGNFDFSTASGEIADFVSIYAPNGFGKSSFYDAIEWAMTNNISRYIRDALRINNDKTSLILNNLEEGQRILRNRYIAEDAPSHVNVETTFERPFFRRVPSARANSRDYTYDRKNTDPVTKHLAEIFLAQDAIDAFLKEDRPELRYEKFMSGFGGEDELYRQKLQVIRKSADDELNNLNVEIAKLQEIVNDPSHKFGLEQVNLTIKALNEAGEVIDPVTEEYSPISDVEYKSRLAQLTADKNNYIEITKEKISLINTCISSIPEAQRNNKLIEELRKKLKSLKDNDLNLEIIESKKNQINELESIVTKLFEERVDLERLSLNLEQFIKSHIALSADLFRKRTLGYKRDELLNNLKVAAKEIDNKRSQVALLNADHFKIQQDVQIAPLKYQDLSSNERQLTSDRAKLESIKKRIDTSTAASVALANEIKRIQGIPESQEIIHTSALAALGASQDFIISFSDKLSLLQSARELNKNLKLESLIVGQKNQEMFELVTLANKILSHNHSNICPVCDSEFNSFEELSKKIMSNTSISEKQQEFAARLETSERELEYAENAIRDATLHIRSLKIAKISKLSADAATTTNATNLLLSEKLLLDHQIEVLQRKIEEDRKLLEGLSLDEYIDNRHSRTNENRAKRSYMDQSLLELNLAVTQFQEEIDDLSSQIAALDVSIDGFEKSDFNREFIEYLKSNAVEYEDAKQFLSEKSADLHSVMEGHRNAIADAKVVVHRITQTILESSGMMDIELVQREITNLNEELRRAEEPYILFCARLEALTGYSDDPLNWNSALEDVRAAQEKLIEQSRDVLKLLETLQLQLKDVLPFIEYSNSKRALTEKQEILSKYKILNLQLNEEFHLIEKSLQHLISNFFYTDLINNIYRKIDPHPTFKKVKFECIFSDTDKPRLEVYLCDTNERRIAPNLYFSAAQLNILSLSIFLARALHVEHEGSPVETILIDDPIHSMDSINILSTIDLLRNISTQFGRQIILSTHDENFFELLKTKLPPNSYRSKFIKLESYGKVARI